MDRLARIAADLHVSVLDVVATVDRALAYPEEALPLGSDLRGAFVAGRDQLAAAVAELGPFLQSIASTGFTDPGESSARPEGASSAFTQTNITASPGGAGAG